MAAPAHAIALIYLGGTLGCIGTPLQPLPAGQFLPLLQQLCQQHFAAIGLVTSSATIKDSSQLSPHDWQELIEQLTRLQSAGYQKMLVIHGTDTLAYTAAFLADYVAVTGNRRLQLVLTGSQYPLLQSDGLRLDMHSDAFGNLLTAHAYLSQQHGAGCHVAFDQQIWPAQVVQKIHTARLPAFAADPAARVSYLPSMAHLQHDWSALAQLNIAVLYALPLSGAQQGAQLQQLLHCAAAPSVQAIILMAFGAGNLNQHMPMQQALQQAAKQQVLVVVASQVAFGGVRDDYAAGHWLRDYGVLSGGNLTIAAIYARLALLLCMPLSFQARKTHWRQALAPAG